MTDWTDDQIADLRDYVALGYKLEEILTETGRAVAEVTAKLVEIGISSSVEAHSLPPSGGSESREDSPEYRAPAPSSEADVGSEKPSGTAAPISNLADASAPAGRAGEGGRCPPTSSPVDLSASDGKRWDALSNAERLYQVRKLADGSVSYTEIARQLGTSRGAISGFVDRNRAELGIDKLGQGQKGGRPRAKRPEAPSARTATPSLRAPSIVTPMPAPKLAKPSTAPIVPPDPSAVVSLADAGMHRCHFPLWAHGVPSPSMEDGKACGMPTRPGAPYCPHHCAIAYRPEPPRASRKDKEAA